LEKKDKAIRCFLEEGVSEKLADVAEAVLLQASDVHPFAMVVAIVETAGDPAPALDIGQLYDLSKLGALHWVCDCRRNLRVYPFGWRWRQGGCPNFLESRHMQNRAPLSAHILCFQAKGVGEVVRSVSPAWALNGMCACRRGGPSRGGRLVACPPVVEVVGEFQTKQGIPSHVQHRHNDVRMVESASSSRHAGVQSQKIYDETQ